MFSLSSTTVRPENHMSGKNACKRREGALRDLAELECLCKTAPESEVPASFGRYQRRLGEIQAGWYTEMKRRAGLLQESDPSNPCSDRENVHLVWNLVHDIRE